MIRGTQQDHRCITKQIVELINTMIQELSEDTDKKLAELSKMILNMNDKFTKESESI